MCFSIIFGENASIISKLEESILPLPISKVMNWFSLLRMSWTFQKQKNRFFQDVWFSFRLIQYFEPNQLLFFNTAPAKSSSLGVSTSYFRRWYPKALSRWMERLNRLLKISGTFDVDFQDWQKIVQKSFQAFPLWRMFYFFRVESGKGTKEELKYANYYTAQPFAELNRLWILGSISVFDSSRTIILVIRDCFFSQCLSYNSLTHYPPPWR